MLPVIYGVISSIAWGASDFSGGLASRKTNAVLVIFIGEVVGMFILPAAAILSHEKIMPWQDWLWCLAAGGVGINAVVMFYRALARGRMSETALISGIVSAAVPVVVGSFMEGLPGLSTIIAFALALVSVWLVTQMDEKESGKKRLSFAEIRLPLLAGLGFGLYFVFIHQGSHNQIFMPMIGSRTASLVVLGTLLVAQRKVKMPDLKSLPLILLNFSTDIVGNTAYIVAGQLGRLDVSAALASLYPGFTVLLAAVFLHERISTRQWAGILLALGAIVLFSI